VYKAVKNGYGFISVEPIPSKDELKNFYEKKYYQNYHGSYQKSYTKDELKYFFIEADITKFILDKFIAKEKLDILDLGCGEGFFANYFYKNNHNITTSDFSDHGLLKHNKHLLETFIKGDILSTIDTLNDKNKKFDFINLKNVLEHVIDPTELLANIKNLLSSNSIIRIEVPNDFSKFQKFLLDQDLTTQTWFAPPEHLHYFNFDNIQDYLKSLNFNINLIMSDFPIEIFLANEVSNYTKDKNVGKDAHKARVRMINFLYEQGKENFVDYFKSSAKINLGRQIIVYVQL